MLMFGNFLFPQTCSAIGCAFMMLSIASTSFLTVSKGLSIQWLLNLL